MGSAVRSVLFDHPVAGVHLADSDPESDQEEHVGSFRSRTRGGATLLVALALITVSLVSSCAATPPSPGSECLEKKGVPELPPPLWLRWNGLYGGEVNVHAYLDAGCTERFPPQLNEHGTYVVADMATVSSPAPPLPPEYASWSVVPASFGAWDRPWVGTPQHLAATSACLNLYGHPLGPTEQMFSTYLPDGVLGSLPDDLWGCVLMDMSPIHLVWPVSTD